MTTSLDAEPPLTAAQAGSKAARLARLRTDGFPVPAGAVLPVELFATATPQQLATAARAAREHAGPGPLAVRSSALAEDQHDASLAGAYDSVLGVEGLDGLLDAIDRVRHSGPGQIAVLVQHQVDAVAAGVAFTADPLTGDRHRTTVSATHGLGDQLASGGVTGETWTVVDGHASHAGDTAAAAMALTAARACQVADLAHRVQEHEGCPQDIEWAFDDHQLWLLQARPMTALPEPVSWDAPAPGWWRRDFRFAEWLPEPVTPLFATWFFPRQEAAYMATNLHEKGLTQVGPFHVVVNGWAYCNDGTVDATMRRAMRRHPITTARVVSAFATIGRRPALGERVLAQPSWEAYQQRLLPAYRHAVAHAEAHVDELPLAQLPAVVDGLIDHIGALGYSLTGALGYAGKAEFSLANRYRTHLHGELGGSYLTLLGGLLDPAPSPPHTVTSLDWRRPTLGELHVTAQGPSPESIERLRTERDGLEAECRRVLAGRPRQLARFEQSLRIARRWAVIREGLATDLTRAWPAMRRAILRCGSHLVDHRALQDVDDVFFLERAELVAALGAPERAELGSKVQDRRRAWQRSSLLAPPIGIGDPSPPHTRVDRVIPLLRSDPATATDRRLVGTPASVGLATGPVRIMRNPADVDRIEPGDVLVAAVTSPAWSPLFGRVAAVVTDSGSAAAHASIIAREYGIPAVVGTGDATARLRDGQHVTVDGGRGTVELLG